MANPSKRKGTAWETALVHHLNTTGLGPVERRALNGTHDRGDIAGLTAAGRWTVECKNTRTLDLAAALDEATTEQANNGDPWHAAVIKRRRRPTPDAYVVMTLTQWVDLLHALRSATEAHPGTNPHPRPQQPAQARTDAHST